MQPAVAQNEQRVALDVATTIAATMRQMGVVGLPRNYEIFYEAITGSNPELSHEFLALGNRPTQAELDRIGRKYFAQSHGQGIVENALDIIARELEDVAKVLRNGQGNVEKYGRLLHETSTGLENRTAMSHELLQQFVGTVSTATASKIELNQEVVARLGEKTAELENVKSKLEEYKRLADTDPLTYIWNRRAFDKEIAKIYNDKTDIVFGALILADIDFFKEINDRFGHPVGDMIIQVIANIFKSTIPDDMFVARTGGEEFAIIATGSDEETAARIADRVRAIVEQTVFTDKRTGVSYGPITISMGVCMAADAEGPDDLYTNADRALYASKAAGRNRVTKFSAVPEHRTAKNWLVYSTD